MINTSKIFLAWLTTVFVGSICLIIGFVTVQQIIREDMDLNSYLFRDVLWGIILSIAISGLISLPTMITLTISNIRLNNQNLPFKLQFKKLNKIHIFMAVLTFAVIEGIVIYNAIESYNFYKRNHMNFNFFDSSFFYLTLSFLGIISWYVICAILIWFLFFKKEIREMRSKK